MNESQTATSKNEPDRMRRRAIPAGLPKWASWTDLPAWIVSMVVHILAMILLAWLWQPIRRGSGGETDRSVGIAVVHVTPSGTEYDLEVGGPVAELQSLSPMDFTLSDPPLNAESLLAGISSIGQGSSSGDGASEGQGLSNLGNGSPVSGNGRGMKTTTSIYGVQGEGNSFAYVIDRSDSMNGYGGGPFRSAKKELVQSLKSLKPSNLFQIIFYNENPTAYASRISTGSGMLSARESELEYAIQYVERMSATGGTEHVAALKMGIRFLPDVLFFLTDADEPRMSNADLESIVSLCERSGTTIHAIEFGSGPSGGPGRWIEVLASRTGGKYRYVNAKTLAGNESP